ncbi:hypothetical protein RQP46_009722 [Phenoliferia psychrophenolica]
MSSRTTPIPIRGSPVISEPKSRNGSIHSSTGPSTSFSSSYSSSSFVRPTGLAGSTRLPAAPSTSTPFLAPSLSRRTSESIAPSDESFVEPTCLGNKPTKGGMRVGLENAAGRIHDRLATLTHTAQADHIMPSSLTARIQRYGKLEGM